MKFNWSTESRLGTFLVGASMPLDWESMRSVIAAAERTQAGEVRFVAPDNQRTRIFLVGYSVARAKSLPDVVSGSAL